MTVVKLRAPDSRICGRCLGMGWLYIEDDNAPPPKVRLVRCELRLSHNDALVVTGNQEIPTRSQQ